MAKGHTLRPWCLGALVALMSSSLLGWGPAWGAVDGLSQVQLLKTYGKLPLHFIHNQGQTDARVKYYNQGGGSAFFFTRQGVVLSLPGSRDQSARERTAGKEIVPWQPHRSQPGRQMVVQLNPVGMSPGVEMSATDPQGGRFNYFFGNDPGKWRTNIPTYGAVIYQGAYPGVDLKFYGNGRQLEYDLIVQPGADPSGVKFQYRGIKGLGITREGDLAIRLPDGENLIQKKPVVYQEIAGQRVARQGKFKVLADDRQFIYGFEVAAYDRKHPLVIDPKLEYSSYLGGSSFDEGSGIAVDASGCAYVTGYTYSGDFPLEPSDNQHIEPGITSAVFVTKVNEAGTGLVYSTLVGGKYDNYANAIAVDNEGCAYVAGGARDQSFPTTGGIQDFGGGTWDAFVFKLSQDGSDLIYSTFLGGSDLDIARGVAINGDDVLVTGKTFSPNFPFLHAAQAKLGGGGEGFLTSLHFDGSSLSMNYSTYLGGTGDDAGNGIAVDGAGNAYVVGETNFRNFYTTSKAGGTGNYDAFVAKFDRDGVRKYSLRLGGSNYESGQGIAVDGSGTAYVTGYTYSGTGFPTTNALNFTGVAAAQTAESGAQKVSAANKGGGSKTNIDAFVTKISSDGRTLLYSMRLGGSGSDYGFGIAVDTAGCAYVTGGTSSSDFPTTSNRLAAPAGGRNVFVTKLNDSGNSAVFSTCLPGNGDQEGSAIAVGASGTAYLTGYTYSTADFITLNPFQPLLNGSGNGSFYDAFVTKIREIP